MKGMLLVTVLAGFVLAAAAQYKTWNPVFDYTQCYNVDATQRMPNTLDNLIGILLKFENATSNYMNMDEMAEMIIKRYRTDGIVRKFSGNGWGVGDVDKETEKQELINKIVKPVLSFPEDSFDFREECGLHMLVSHSTDDYPMPGIDAIWNGEIDRTNRGDRNKRSYSSSNNYNSNSGNINGINSDDSNSRGLGNYDRAVHPVENGVMETQYGPVAAGTLLTGLMSMDDTSSYSMTTILGDTDYMPNEMKTKTLTPLYAASLSGDLGQMALTALRSDIIVTDMGPSGRYNNCTICAKYFSLSTNAYTLLSRAELHAGLDVMLINLARSTGGSSSLDKLSLAQLLKLYYSEKGLPDFPEIKACNRMGLYDDLNRDEIYDQALNFMYAYQNDFNDLKDQTELQKDDFVGLEEKYEKYLTATRQAMEKYIKSDNQDDEGYNSKCQYSGIESGGSQSMKQPPSETVVDLIAVYGADGTTDQNRNQRQMIADVARHLRMDTLQSALGVLGPNGEWILDYTNVTNLGDWGCNFTENYNGPSVSSMRNDGISLVIEKLSIHYAKQYQIARENQETSSGNSQVVLWQVPGTVPGDETTNNNTIQEFRAKYPDVRIVFVGRTESAFKYLLNDEDDFLSVSGLQLNEVSIAALAKVHDSPRYFIYPACDPNNPNITNIDNYREDSHNYRGAVTPNFTTYISIPPHNFYYSENVILTVSGDVRTCASRTNRFALEYIDVENINNELNIQSSDDQLQCIGGLNDVNEQIKYKWPCDRYLRTCNPIYLSITGQSQGQTGQTSCSGSQANCEFPHQITYELKHEGMTCGASASVPFVFLLMLPALLHYYSN